MKFSVLAVSAFSLTLSSLSWAEHPHAPPENGSPLRLISVEDGNSGPKTASDLLVGAAGIYGLAGAAGLSYWAHEAGTDPYIAAALADFGLAVGLTNAVTFSVKSILSRARPYTYSPNYPIGYSEYEQNDGFYSFPSGHAANAAAFTFSLATSAAYHLPEFSNRTWVVAGLYTLATASTLTVAELRVRAGFHFYSDVFAGGFIGTTFGVVGPVLNHLLAEAFDSPEPGMLSIAADSKSTQLLWRGTF